MVTEDVHFSPLTSSIEDNLATKTKKYSVLGLPIIIAGVRHYHSDATPEEIEDLLLRGHSGGLFNRYPELSAVIWAEPFQQPPSMQTWCNSNATHPVSATFLDDLRL